MYNSSRWKWLYFTILTLTIVPYIWLYQNIGINEQNCIFVRLRYNLYQFLNGNSTNDEDHKKMVNFAFSTIQRCSSNKKTFRILMWTKWYGEAPNGSHNLFGSLSRSRLCDDLNPIITWNRADYDDADVVIFQQTDLNFSTELPKYRNPRVPWILAVQEAPIDFDFKDSSDFNGVFNWTWSLRSDSEIHAKFSDMVKLHSFPDLKWKYGSNFSKEFMRKKTQMAAWVVSNCHPTRSKHGKFATTLLKHGVNFTIYGNETLNDCSDNFPYKRCPQDGIGESCFNELGRTHKFYFAFENFLCIKFMTEKLFWGLFYSMVPIYYGLADDIRERVPPNSYIDAMAFNTTKELAEYLNYLNSNDKEYFKYFEWRQNYSVDVSDFIALKNLYHCSVWKKMSELVEISNTISMRRTYHELDEWLRTFYNSKLNKTCGICLKEQETSIKRPSQNRIFFYNNLSRCNEQKPEVRFEENKNKIDIDWID